MKGYDPAAEKPQKNPPRKTMAYIAIDVDAISRDMRQQMRLSQTQ
jgi:hypothetical protein